MVHGLADDQQMQRKRRSKTSSETPTGVMDRSAVELKPLMSVQVVVGFDDDIAQEKNGVVHSQREN